jgi:uncharacterized protein (TIGR02271 family)
MPIFAKSAVAQAATDATATAPTANTVRIEGSSSMKVTNDNRTAQIKQQSPDAQIITRYDGADAALKSVLNGNADLAAIGRPLTQREQQEGLVAVPQKRQKIAIIVSAKNRFTSNLTFEQFAKIFRGEIKDWSELGAPPGRIQLVDRPATNDTRLALQNYAVFKQAPFVAAPNAIKLTDDSIEAAIAQLGPRGITYTVSDAIDNIPGIRIVPMHKTLPRDPRYPFSQPLAYVYKGPTPSPAAAAFLGGTVAAAAPSAAAPAPVQTTSTTTVTRSTTDDSFPWLLLLLFPLLGGLLWWALRRRPAPPVAVVTPRVAPVAPPVVPAPVVPVVPAPVAPVVAAEPIKLYEERLIADKTRQKVGGVAINKRIETEGVEVAIPVARERIQIERIAPSDPVAIPVEDVRFGDGQVRMETYEQVPQIHKEAFVREEVEIAKKIDRETATAQDTLRHEEIDVRTQPLPHPNGEAQSRPTDRDPNLLN